MKKKLKNIIKSFVLLFKRKKIVPINRIVDSNLMLKNKVAFITGGSGGIGSAIAEKFVRSGCKVVISGTSEKKLITCCKKIGGDCTYVVMDISDTAVFENKITEVIGKYGKIDILVNSAGIHTVRPDLDFTNITEKEYDHIMDVNLKGTYFISQYISKYMIKEKIKGHILFISSQRALEPAWSPYRLSKWGVKGLTLGLAQSLLKYGIIVNGIALGPTATSMQPYIDGDSIYTDQNPIGRYTMPNEIAEYALLLVSELGNTVVGDTIYMTGGGGLIELR